MYTSSLKSLCGHSILDQANGLPVAPRVVVHVHFDRIELEVPRALRTVGSGRPIGAVGTHAEHIATAIAPARSGQKDGFAV